MSGQSSSISSKRALSPSPEVPNDDKKKLSKREALIDSIAQSKIPAIEPTPISFQKASLSMSNVEYQEPDSSSSAIFFQSSLQTAIQNTSSDFDEKEAEIGAADTSSFSSSSSAKEFSSVPVNVRPQSPDLRIQEVQDPIVFHKAIVAAKYDGKEQDISSGIFGTKESKWFGAFVHTYSVEEYQNVKKFLTNDRQSGFAIDDAAVISVFKHPKNKIKEITDFLLPRAIQEGGTRLDCFNGVLPKIYSKYGFVPVAKAKFNPEFAPEDWNYSRDGQPDIIFMIYNEQAVRNFDIINKKSSDLIVQQIQDLPYSTYDEAVATCKVRLDSNLLGTSSLSQVASIDS